MDYKYKSNKYRQKLYNIIGGNTEPVLEKKTADFIFELAKSNSKPINELDVDSARNVLNSLQEKYYNLIPANIEDVRTIYNSVDISFRIIRPTGTETQILPVLIYVHGGGWILGNDRTHDHLVRKLGLIANVAVVFVNYTLSPEAKFPVALKEIYNTIMYIHTEGRKYYLNPDNISIAGDSAGGNMAIAACLLLKQKKLPLIKRQVLFYPVTSADMNTESYAKYKNGPWLTKASMEWFWNAYEPNMANRNNILVSPLKANTDDLRNLPPTLIITDENDVLRDEGEQFAQKLMEADVDVTSVRYQGTIHDFAMLGPLIDTPASNSAIVMAALFLTT